MILLEMVGNQTFFKICKDFVIKVIKQVNGFNYLGSWITSDRRCDKDIKWLMGMTKDALLKMKNILTNTKIDMK